MIHINRNPLRKELPLCLRFYAHYRFGCDVLKQLPEDIRSICTAHRGLFDIGLHGPDIYFFYRPVLPNKVNRIGYAAHKRSGRYIFTARTEGHCVCA